MDGYKQQIDDIVLFCVFSSLDLKMFSKMFKARIYVKVP